MLKDLGYGGAHGFSLYGASPDFGSAVKALVLQGFRAIPDCSFRDIGADVVWSDAKSTYFITVVLAG